MIYFREWGMNKKMKFKNIKWTCIYLSYFPTLRFYYTQRYNKTIGLTRLERAHSGLSVQGFKEV